MAAKASKRVLLTGATGFIGGHLLRHLLSKGYDVWCVVRGKSHQAFVASLEELSPGVRDRVHVVVAELDDGAALEEAVSKCVREQAHDDATTQQDTLPPHQDTLSTHEDIAVIHLAAYMDFFPSSEATIFKVNVEGTRNLIHACGEVQERCGVRVVFVYCSSTEVYGGRPHPSPPTTEQDACTPQYAYGRSKVLAEQAVRDEARVKSIILRPTGVFGPGDRFVVFELMQMISWGLLPCIPGSGSPLLMFTHVDDVCSALILAAECSAPPSLGTDERAASAAEKGGGGNAGEAASHTDDEVFRGAFNVCPDDALSYQEWIEHLSLALGRAKPLVHVPLSVVWATVYLAGPLFNIGKRRTFMFHPYTIERMAEDRAFSNGRARSVLGFEPTHSLRSGLTATVDHYIAHGVLTRYPYSPFALISLFLLALVCIAVYACV